MESLPAAEEQPISTVMTEDAPKEAVQSVENDTDNTDAPSANTSKLDEEEKSGEPVQKKRRSGGQRNRYDSDLIAEARAAYGELDASEGRRLRKRPEPKEAPPPKKASPKKSTTPRGRKKKVAEEDVKDEDTAKQEDSKAEDEGNPPVEKPADDKTEAADDNTASSAEHTADVKEVAEEETTAETQDNEPAVTEVEPVSGPEAASSIATTCSAAEAVAAPTESKQVEQPESQESPMEQGSMESTASLAAASE